MSDVGRRPLGVRILRGAIAVLVWAALALPIGGVFRWVGEALAMPPSYGPTWRAFVVVVGVVLFVAFVVDRDTEAATPRADSGPR